MNIRTRASLLTAAIVLPLGLTACDPPQPFLGCGSISYAPQSDWGMFDIKAYQTTCGTARAVADAGKWASGAYNWGTWRCPEPEARPLGVHYHCNGPSGAQVTFEAS